MTKIAPFYSKGWLMHHIETSSDNLNEEKRKMVLRSSTGGLRPHALPVPHNYFDPCNYWCVHVKSLHKTDSFATL